MRRSVSKCVSLSRPTTTTTTTEYGRFADRRYADNVGRFADTYNCIKTAFHDTDKLADIRNVCRRNVRTPQQQAFNGPLSRTTRLRQCEKGKTGVDLLKQVRVTLSQWHQLDYTVCRFAPDRQTDRQTCSQIATGQPRASKH